MNEIERLLGTQHEDALRPWVMRAVLVGQAEWVWHPDDYDFMDGDGRWTRSTDLSRARIGASDGPGYTVTTFLRETVRTDGTYAHAALVEVDGTGALSEHQAQEMRRYIDIACEVARDVTR